MYLLDTNVFIEAQNRYYANDICPGFWNWLDHAMDAGGLASITSVYDELADKDDYLAEWVRNRRDTGWFLDVTDTVTQQSFAEVVQFVESVPRYSRPHKDAFLRKADPWLVAMARTKGFVVVTHESFNAETTKVKIPNVCQNFNIDYHDTFQVLRGMAASFSWVP
ncbi:MAG: DUF4411 family protein [Pseudomonadota bacterium]